MARYKQQLSLNGQLFLLIFVRNLSLNMICYKKKAHVVFIFIRYKREIYPEGKVPVLKYGQEVIPESMVIVELLHDLYPLAK